MKTFFSKLQLINNKSIFLHRSNRIPNTNLVSSKNKINKLPGTKTWRYKKNMFNEWILAMTYVYILNKYDV